MNFCTKAFLFLFLLSSAAGSYAASPPSDMPLLQASGTDIVDSTGKPLVLTGINLGGWLVEEPWMEPFVTNPPAGSAFAPIKDHVTLWGTVEQRFGVDGREKVRTAFRDAWITEADFKRMHDLGFNVVRLPFLASLVTEPNGFHWLDQAIAWASENHIYVILDMHGAPGSQSDQDHTGQEGLNQFFKDHSNVLKAEAVWTEIAARYHGNTAVAGYDMLNEPMGTPNSDTLYVIEDQLYRAIRAGDPTHLIFIEDGYTGVQWMPIPGPVGWTNVVYSTHYYNFTAKSAADQQGTLDSYTASVDKERQRRNIPFYVGEYCIEPNGTPDELTGFVQNLIAKHISSTIWTYKVSMTRGGQSFWGLYSNANAIAPLDFYTDSEADLMTKCNEIRTENLDLNSNEQAAFQKALQH